MQSNRTGLPVQKVGIPTIQAITPKISTIIPRVINPVKTVNTVNTVKTVNPVNPVNPVNTMDGINVDVIKMIVEMREQMREYDERKEEEYRKITRDIISEMRQEHEKITKGMREYQDELEIKIESQGNRMETIVEMLRQQENKVSELSETVDEIRRSLIRETEEEEEEEEEEEISTVGGNIISKEKVRKLKDEEIRILLNRIGKNITTYEKKGEKEAELVKMKDTQKKLREIQEEKRRIKRGTAIKV